MRALAMLGALFGLGFGLQVGCGGACADTGSHECCAGSHCNCAGAHCNCADAPAEDPGQHNHCHQVLRSDYECTVAWLDENGASIEEDSYLYENFVSALAVTDTCNSLQADNPDRPDEAASGVCSCARVDDQTVEQIAAPS